MHIYNIRKLYKKICHKLTTRGYIVEFGCCEFISKYRNAKHCAICNKIFNDGCMRLVRLFNIDTDHVVRIKNIAIVHRVCNNSKKN